MTYQIADATHLLLKGYKNAPHNRNMGFPLFLGNEVGCMTAIQYTVNHSYAGYTINKVTKVDDSEEYLPCRRIIYSVLMTSDYFTEEPVEDTIIFIIVKLPLHINRKLSKEE